MPLLIRKTRCEPESQGRRYWGIPGVLRSRGWLPCWPCQHRSRARNTIQRKKGQGLTELGQLQGDLRWQGRSSRHYCSVVTLRTMWALLPHFLTWKPPLQKCWCSLRRDAPEIRWGQECRPLSLSRLTTRSLIKQPRCLDYQVEPHQTGS